MKLKKYKVMKGLNLYFGLMLKKKIEGYYIFKVTPSETFIHTYLCLAPLKILLLDKDKVIKHNLVLDPNQIKKIPKDISYIVECNQHNNIKGNTKLEWK